MTIFDYEPVGTVQFFLLLTEALHLSVDPGWWAECHPARDSCGCCHQKL